MAGVNKNLPMSEKGSDSGIDRKTKSNLEKVKLYKCTYCAYMTPYRYSVNRHSQLHTGEKNFKCEICNYRAIQKSDVTKHAVSHTGKKPYPCNSGLLAYLYLGVHNPVDSSDGGVCDILGPLGPVLPDARRTSMSTLPCSRGGRRHSWAKGEISKQRFHLKASDVKKEWDEENSGRKGLTFYRSVRRRLVLKQRLTKD
ncbi:hypothetical protein LAZ67_9001841 [Cordylochernes scorpioides]|uniref:C2H2-type domain-containing protein n=1 Tax=Cordylochernes scorpioides TaxID=51811 RepID=A0ABY6KX09_9ARAC|nr:hypothetical protein LAZ67_9001841 [Cordylochernes scorpioides]